MKTMAHGVFVVAFLCISALSFAQPSGNRKPHSKSDRDYKAYLFTYFTGNGGSQEAIRFALSRDGYHYRALNNNEPIIASETISSTGGVRDPHILRGEDGKTFYMVATDMVAAKGWDSNRAMVLMKSNDLIHWTSSVVNIQKRFPGNDSLMRVWAPQTIYDEHTKKYMIYFSMKHGKRGKDKIYYAYANDDFTDLEREPQQMFYSPDSAACIDGDIVEKDGKYFLFFKTEDRHPGIKIAVSDKLTSGYVMQSQDYVQQTQRPVEGAGTFRLNDGSGYILMYDMYTSGRYQFTKTTDLKNFKVIDEDVTMNFHPRHGTIVPITPEEAGRLARQWMSHDDIITDVTSDAVKKINVALDTTGTVLTIPVRPGTDLKSFDPGFVTYPGISVVAESKNFKKPVQCVVTIDGRGSRSYSAVAKEDHNPVLTGLYADPDIFYSEKMQKFYMYPTSDGFRDWQGTYFKAFSSSDLVSWKDEGVILDLPKDVAWAKSRAWAPCIAEKKIGGQYKYFFYYCAEAKIGVAVSDSPTGPFVDTGRPLIDKRPDGFSRNGQAIDPDVFRDPRSGKYYLYWGNGYMAGAELNDDMVSLKTETIKELTPESPYTEGTHVFYRNGTYYFTWSQNDTRDPNYRVRYGTTRSPLEKISIPVDNLVIVKDEATRIYGTGHNSTIQVPGKDEWYLVYHRFNYPQGINMGGDAGYNRETCIDKMEFDPDGTIKMVKPTHEGIRPVAVKTGK